MRRTMITALTGLALCTASALAADPSAPDRTRLDALVPSLIGQNKADLPAVFPVLGRGPQG